MGTNTRAAAESSPFCNARDISLGESERSGRDDDKEGVLAVLVVVGTVTAVAVATVVADPVVAAAADTAAMDGEDTDEAAAFTAAVAAASCRCRCCPW